MPFLRGRRVAVPKWLSVAFRAVLTVAIGSTGLAYGLAELGEHVGNVPSAVSAGDPPAVELSPLAARSFIYDQNGAEMAVLFAEEDREIVALDEVPKLLIDTVLAVEDRDFYRHSGVNPRSTVRALFTNLSAGEIEEGGSTITQQLVKNAVVGGQQTITRKLKEAVLARRLETQMSKNQILERYLNTIYLGNGAYGMQAGSETYFGKDVGQLTLAEAAMLTALIRYPVGYDPVRHPDVAAERRDLVLDVLDEQGVASEAEVAEARREPLPLRTHERGGGGLADQLQGANYFTEHVKQLLLKDPRFDDVLGVSAGSDEDASPARFDAVFRGGIRVYTTFDAEAQRAAEVAAATLPDTGGTFTAAIASVQPGTGAVRAVVGGSDFDTEKYNNAIQGRRPPGSSFKTFVLLAALEAGYVPNDTISGARPCSFRDPAARGGIYTVDANERSGKTTTITAQTMSSNNCAYLRLGQTVGLDKVAALATSMGLSATLDPDEISMPLGTTEASPLEMAAAYAAIANDGVYMPPYFIDRIENEAGEVIWQNELVGTTVVSPQSARLATEVLAQNVTGGTGRKARLARQPAAGKTGTTNENTDVWFVGFTPQLATAVWVGSPRAQVPIIIRGSRVYGADYPAEIWASMMNQYTSTRQVVEFPEPESTRRGRYIGYSNGLRQGCGSSCSSSSTSRSTSRSTRSTSTRRTTTTIDQGDDDPDDTPPRVTAPTVTSTTAPPDVDAEE